MGGGKYLLLALAIFVLIVPASAVNTVEEIGNPWVWCAYPYATVNKLGADYSAIGVNDESIKHLGSYHVLSSSDFSISNLQSYEKFNMAFSSIDEAYKNFKFYSLLGDPINIEKNAPGTVTWLDTYGVTATFGISKAVKLGPLGGSVGLTGKQSMSETARTIQGRGSLATAERAYRTARNLDYVYYGLTTYNAFNASELEAALLDDITFTGLDEAWRSYPLGQVETYSDVYALQEGINADGLGTSYSDKTHEMLGGALANWSANLATYQQYILSKVDLSDYPLIDCLTPLSEWDGYNNMPRICGNTQISAIDELTRTHRSLAEGTLCGTTEYLNESHVLETTPPSAPKIGKMFEFLAENNELAILAREYRAFVGFFNNAQGIVNLKRLDIRRSLDQDVSPELEAMSRQGYGKIDEDVFSYLANLAETKEEKARLSTGVGASPNPKTALNLVNRTIQRIDESLADLEAGREQGVFKSDEQGYMARRLVKIKELEDNITRCGTELSTARNMVASLHTISDKSFYKKIDELMSRAKGKVSVGPELNILKSQYSIIGRTDGNSLAKKYLLFKDLEKVEARVVASERNAAGELLLELQQNINSLEQDLRIASSGRGEVLGNNNGVVRHGEELRVDPSITLGLAQVKAAVIKLQDFSDQRQRINETDVLITRVDSLKEQLYRDLENRYNFVSERESLKYNLPGILGLISRTDEDLAYYQLAESILPDEVGEIRPPAALGMMREIKEKYGRLNSTVTRIIDAQGYSQLKLLVPLSTFAPLEIVSDSQVTVVQTVKISNEGSAYSVKPVEYSIAVPTEPAKKLGSQNVEESDGDLSVSSSGKNVILTVSNFQPRSSVYVALKYLVLPLVTTTPFTRDYISSDSYQRQIDVQVSCAYQAESYKAKVALPAGWQGAKIEAWRDGAQLNTSFDGSNLLADDTCLDNHNITVLLSFSNPLAISFTSSFTPGAAISVTHQVTIENTLPFALKAASVFYPVPYLSGYFELVEGSKPVNTTKSGESLVWVEDFKAGEKKTYSLTFKVSNVTQEDLDSLDRQLSALLGNPAFSCEKCCLLDKRLSDEASATSSTSALTEYVSKSSLVSKLKRLQPLAEAYALESAGSDQSVLATSQPLMCDGDVEAALTALRKSVNDLKKYSARSCNEIEDRAVLFRRLARLVDQKIDYVKQIEGLRKEIVLGAEAASLASRLENLQGDATYAERDCNGTLMASVEASLDSLRADVEFLEKDYSGKLYTFLVKNYRSADFTVSLPKELVDEVKGEFGNLTPASSQVKNANSELATLYESGNYSAALKVAVENGIEQGSPESTKTFFEQAQVYFSMANSSLEKLRQQDPSGENYRYLSETLSAAQKYYDAGKLGDASYAALFVYKRARDSIPKSIFESFDLRIVIAIVIVAAAAVLVARRPKKKDAPKPKEKEKSDEEFEELFGEIK